MKTEDAALELEERIRQVCNPQRRYHVLWIVGKPHSGKTSLVRHICAIQGWRYVNFTLDHGFFDSLIGREETYQPEDFREDLYQWCAATTEEYLVLDEIEPLLGPWNWKQQELFFRLIGRATNLPVGVALVTRIRTAQQIHETLSDIDQDHIYELLPGVCL